MAVRKIVSARADPGGAYNIFEVRPLAGAVGGTPQKRPPFTGPAAVAVAEVAGQGLGNAFAVDVGSGFAHVYVRVNPAAAAANRPRPPGQPVVQPTRKQTVQPTGQQMRQVPGQPFTTISRETSGPSTPAAKNNVLTVAEGALDVLRWLGGFIGGKLVKDWAKMSPNTAPNLVMDKAREEESDLIAVGGLLQGIPGAEGVYWMGRQEGGNWFVPISFLPDAEVTPALAGYLIDPNRVFPEGFGPASDINRPPGTTGSTAGEIAYGSLAPILGVPPTRPNTVTVRRCPKGMKLGVDGACYPEKLLNKQTRKNTPKKAPVSWRDAQSISKGRTAQDRINRYADRMDEREHTHRHTHRHRRHR